MSAVQGKRIMYITTRVDVRCHWTIQRHTEHGKEKTKSLKSCIGEAHKHPLCKGYQLTPHKGGGKIHTQLECSFVNAVKNDKTSA